MTSPKTEYRYIPEFDDQSDRKALFELEKRLVNANSPRYKQLTISNYCTGESSFKQKQFEMLRSSRNKRSNSVKTTVSTKKKGKNDKNCKRSLTKITGWLSKNPQKSEENRQMKAVQSNKAQKDTTATTSRNDEETKSKKRERENQQTKAVHSNKVQKEPTATTSRNCEETKSSEESERKKTFKRNTSDSFAKYGIHIPSFEDIIKSQKKYDEHQQFLDKLGDINCSQESLDLNIDEPCLTTTTALNCKDLTKADIKKAFKQNKKYICNIFNGTARSERHERFQRENPEDHFTTRDLKYNTSMIVFTYEQKQELLTQLYKCFDSDSGLGSNNQYYFKVLLPELCLKIFMDVHKMNYDEANEYLENMPLENINISD